MFLLWNQAHFGRKVRLLYGAFDVSYHIFTHPRESLSSEDFARCIDLLKSKALKLLEKDLHAQHTQAHADFEGSANGTCHNVRSGEKD